MRACFTEVLSNTVGGSIWFHSKYTTHAFFRVLSLGFLVCVFFDSSYAQQDPALSLFPTLPPGAHISQSFPPPVRSPLLGPPTTSPAPCPNSPGSGDFIGPMPLEDLLEPENGELLLEIYESPDMFDIEFTEWNPEPGGPSSGITAHIFRCGF